MNILSRLQTIQPFLNEKQRYTSGETNSLPRSFTRMHEDIKEKRTKLWRDSGCPTRLERLISRASSTLRNRLVASRYDKASNSLFQGLRQGLGDLGKELYQELRDTPGFRNLRQHSIVTSMSERARNSIHKSAQSFENAEAFNEHLDKRSRTREAGTADPRQKLRRQKSRERRAKTVSKYPDPEQVRSFHDSLPLPPGRVDRAEVAEERPATSLSHEEERLVASLKAPSTRKKQPRFSSDIREYYAPIHLSRFDAPRVPRGGQQARDKADSDGASHESDDADVMSNADLYEDPPKLERTSAPPVFSRFEDRQAGPGTGHGPRKTKTD